MSDVAIDQHGLLADCGGSALVTAAGSVDWLCLPRFDSAPVFARLLDPDAGHFLITPALAGWSAHRRYRGAGLVLETTWSGPDGELVVTDALALGRRERGHEIGHSAPGVLLRRAVCTRGTVPVRVEFAPRPEFGLVYPRLEVSQGVVLARGGPVVVALSTSADLDVTEIAASTTTTLSRGRSLDFAVECAGTWDPQPRRRSARRIRRGLRQTEKSWHSWSTMHQNYEGPLRSLVEHSGVVLRGLTYARTGALVAAATTSLPEGVGSGRTWDYRFTWVRDASMTMQGLFVAACPDEAGRFFDFLARAAATQLDRGLDLQIMFGIRGERDLSERQLDYLRGWRDSGPVRAGNGAWSQRQLDVYGSLLDAAYTLRAQLNPMTRATQEFLVAVVDAAATRWAEDDQGIWEVRGPARAYVHSKLMCWVALDRGLRMLTLLGAEDRAAKWEAARAAVAESILAHGWNEQAGAFTQCYGSAELDASVLLIPVVGFLPGDDPRVVSTIDAIETALADESGLLFRYRGGDGFDAAEGTFLLCTFWLAHALALSGQLERAREVLLRAASYASDLGLFAEQVDEDTGELLGNFPQAFSHIGLVTAANALAEAERAAAPSDAEVSR